MTKHENIIKKVKNQVISIDNDSESVILRK